MIWKWNEESRMNTIFDGHLSTPDVLEVLSESRMLEAMLCFEAALARAQADVGLIAQTSAQSIIGTCKVDLFDVPKIVREGARLDGIATSLIQSLKETVGLFNPQAAAFVHFGAGHQDLVDTALVLVTREVLQLVASDLERAIDALFVLARLHAGDAVLARMGLQPVGVTSFGLKCVQWAAPLVRSQLRLQSVASNALRVQLGGAVGTLFEMKGKGAQVMALMAADLQLKESPLAWHTQRDEWLALACELGLLVGSLGKIANDMALLSQFEVAELIDPLPQNLTSGTTQTPTHNTTHCRVALAAAQRVPQRVATLLATLPQEHEQALVNWAVELAEWPTLLLSVHGAARAMAQALGGLQVNTLRMRTNLDAVRATLSARDAKERFGPDPLQHASDLTHQQLEALILLRPPAKRG
jgi:3-carboxy-cis,cis-muconate cycloisomerase